jgi:hypothetical protein
LNTTLIGGKLQYIFFTISHFLYYLTNKQLIEENKIILLSNVHYTLVINIVIFAFGYIKNELKDELQNSKLINIKIYFLCFKILFSY